MNKIIFVMHIIRFVKKIDSVFLINTWCKWSSPATKGSFLFFNLIKLIEVNSYTNIWIDHANNIGWTMLLFARYIRRKDTINPNSKLPLSPKNNFGSLKIAKLKNKKIQRGTNIVIKNIVIVSSEIKKNKIANVEIDIKVRVPSTPSK